MERSEKETKKWRKNGEKYEYKINDKILIEEGWSEGRIEDL